jgi:ribosomal protein L24
MQTSPTPFKKGDRVRVLSGPYEGETGVVVQVDVISTPDGPFEMVWVEMEKEIEGFRPASLRIIRNS